MYCLVNPILYSVIKITEVTNNQTEILADMGSARVDRFRVDNQVICEVKTLSDYIPATEFVFLSESKTLLEEIRKIRKLELDDYSNTLDGIAEAIEYWYDCYSDAICECGDHTVGECKSSIIQLVAKARDIDANFIMENPYIQKFICEI